MASRSSTRDHTAGVTLYPAICMYDASSEITEITETPAGLASSLIQTGHFSVGATSYNGTISDSASHALPVSAPTCYTPDLPGYLNFSKINVSGGGSMTIVGPPGVSASIGIILAYSTDGGSSWTNTSFVASFDTYQGSPGGTLSQSWAIGSTDFGALIGLIRLIASAPSSGQIRWGLKIAYGGNATGGTVTTQTLTVNGTRIK